MLKDFYAHYPIRKKFDIILGVLLAIAIIPAAHSAVELVGGLGRVCRNGGAGEGADGRWARPSVGARLRGWRARGRRTTRGARKIHTSLAGKSELAVRDNEFRLRFVAFKLCTISSKSLM